MKGKRKQYQSWEQVFQSKSPSSHLQLLKNIIVEIFKPSEVQKLDIFTNTFCRNQGA